jgi:hypothetical protein
VYSALALAIQQPAQQLLQQFSPLLSVVAVSCSGGGCGLASALRWLLGIPSSQVLVYLLKVKVELMNHRRGRVHPRARQTLDVEHMRSIRSSTRLRLRQ